MNHETQASVRVYRVKMLARILFIFLFLLYLFVFLGLLKSMFTESHTFVEFIEISGAMGTMLFTIFWAITSYCARLELTSEGVAFIYPGVYRIYTPWENIEKIRKVTWFRISTSFILSKPAAQDISFVDGKRQRQAVIEWHFLLLHPDLSKTSFIIPCLACVPQQEWRDGDLQAYLLRYAPHLLVNNDEYGRIEPL